MNVSGIRPYAGFYDYNSIKANELRSQQVEAPAVANSGASQEAKEREHSQDIPVVQNYSSYDFAQTYRAGETYDLKGLDSDIYSLDVQKAVSDMDRDHVLQQYQFFVGDKSPDILEKQVPDTEKILRSGENFML